MDWKRLKTSIADIVLQFRQRVADSSGRMLDRLTVSIPRACDEVGVSRRTIYNWMSSGKVEYVRTAGGSVRIFRDTLWRDANAPRATSQEDQNLRRTA